MNKKMMNIRGVKENNDIIGCSVSTPFKSKSIKYLSNLDFHSRKLRAINTVVNRNGSLIGYNTDFDSARDGIKELIGTGMYAVDGIMRVATAGDSPRAY